MRRQFIKYFLIGCSAVVLDIGSLFLLKTHLHLRPVWAVVVNQIFILNYVFFLNKRWSFKSQGITHRQIIKFLILSGFNYLFSIGWMWLWNDRYGVNYLIVRIANIALAVAWNFLLYKYWVYKDPAFRHLKKSVK